MLIGLALLFIGPLAFAWMMYFSGAVGHPEGRVNHGILMEPARPLPELELDYLAGEPSEGPDLRGRWYLVQVHPEGCDAACADAIYRSRQVWLALGRRMDRIQRVLLVPEMPPRAEDFLASHPDMLVVDSHTADASRLRQSLSGAAVPDAEIYLIDPLGNLVMVFPADYREEGLLEDLERLLKLSRIG